MKVSVNGAVREYRTVWMEGESVKMIDQTALPHNFRIFETKNSADVAEAIKNMIVRGAPAIGVAAGYGVLLACIEAGRKTRDIGEFREYVKNAAESIRKTRPTAVNLSYVVDKMSGGIEEASEISGAVKCASNMINDIAESEIRACRRIGELGNALIGNNSILTHCNAGALGCVDYGTALSPIRYAHGCGKDIFVFVDETRPRLQGAKLTSWELTNEGIRHAIIADNAAGYLMKKGKIDICIVGADRVAANGDVANKIGTYEKAVLAKENSIPFYVAAPASTIDLDAESGDGIPIEIRDEREVLCIDSIRIAPKGAHAYNPSFDVTDAKYITAIITEKGIIRPREIRKYLR